MKGNATEKDGRKNQCAASAGLETETRRSQGVSLTRFWALLGSKLPVDILVLYPGGAVKGDSYGDGGGYGDGDGEDEEEAK